MNVKFDANGLIPAVVQDATTKQVLMVAYMNEQSLAETMESGRTVFFSRSRQELWRKGDTSGHIQYVKDILLDCDADCLVVLVDQVGEACHTGKKSCFYRHLADLSEVDMDKADESILRQVYNVVIDRRDNPKEGSYTNYLLDQGIDKILKKVGEECSESIIAAKNEDKAEISYEVSDLMYHLIVMLVDRGLTLEDIFEELKGRR